MNPAPVKLLGQAVWSTLGRGRQVHARALRQSLPAADRRKVNGRPVPFRPLASAPERDPLRVASLACAEEALAEAGLGPGQRERCALLLGSSCLDLPWHEAAARDDPSLIIREPNYGKLAARLAEALDLGGPCYTINTACSSSANAMLHAQRLLAAGLCDKALVLGVEIENRVSLQGFAALMLLSPGPYRPFDAERDGLILGEAVAAAVFGGDDDAPGFRLLGGATRCDPSSPTNSDPDGVAALIGEALVTSGLEADELLAVKAHGTGTPNNDRGEAQALRLAGLERVPVTSLKPYTGHTLGACGAVECALLLAAWDEGFLPATPGFRTQDPEVGMAPLTRPQALGPGPVLALSLIHI